MFKVDSKQMQRIKACIGKPLEVQEKVFAELGFSAYDGDCDNLFQVIYADTYNEIKNEIKLDADYYNLFSENRCTEIKKGAVLSLEEEERLHDYIFEDNDEQFIDTAEISDQNDTVFCVYLTQNEGQLGLAVADFFGFYTSKQEAVTAVEKLSDFVFYA